MTLQMTAAVCREFGAPLQLEAVELAAPGAGEVRVKVAACAICHSDLMYMDGAWGGQLPAVFGHEAAGVIESIGDGVAGYSVGDPVVVTLIRACGTCPACTADKPYLCSGTVPLDSAKPLRDADGAEIQQGLRTAAFAEYVTVHTSQIVVIDPGIPLDRASLLACGVMTGLGAVTNSADVEPGSHVVVIGVGGVGLNSVQGAALRNAKTVIALDTEPGKLDTAREFGATHGIDVRRGDAAAEVAKITDGQGADYVFVTVGSTAAVDQSFAMLANGGTLVIVGMPPTGAMSAFEPGALAGYGQSVIGSKMGSSRPQADIPKLVALYLSQQLKLDELISGRYPLSRINDAIASVRQGTNLRNVIVFED